MAAIEDTEAVEVEETKVGIPFKFTSVKQKPSRKYLKGSKYDPILDAFNKGEDNLSQVSVAGVSANYLRTQLNKRIESRKLKVEVSVVNNKLFLEKK